MISSSLFDEAIAVDQYSTNAIHHYAQSLIRVECRELAVIVPGCPFFGSFLDKQKKNMQGVALQRN